MCIHPGEFGAVQEDLRRVIHPDHQHDERARGAEGRADAALAEVKADQQLADGKKHGRDAGADPDVVPGHVHARDEFVDQREKHGGEAEAQHDFEQVGDDFRGAPPFAQGRDRRAEDQRYGEQKRDAEDHAERKQPRAQQVPPALALLTCGRTPDAVERVLQLAEYRHRAKEQSNDADDCGDSALRRTIRRLQQSLDRLCALGADQSCELAEDLAARGFGAEHQPRDRDHDEQQRRNRKQRVIGKCRAHARGVVFGPGGGRLLEKVERGLGRKSHTRTRVQSPRPGATETVAIIKTKS